MSASVTELHSTGSFWTARDELTHIYKYARARRAGPWGTLCATLARATACVPPNIMLPPIIGAPASLNLFVGLVGPSGGGKGACEGASRDAVKFTEYNGIPIFTPELPPGSGEGIARTIRPADTKDDEPNPVPRVLFTAPEIDTLAATASRQGATILAELRKVYAGESIGFANASRATRSVVAAHSYRAGLITGIQPHRAGSLLNDADGGTPQRFLWARVDDPDAPDVAPPAPEPWTVTMRKWGTDPGYLEVPDVAREKIHAHRLAMLRGEDVDPLDGHRMLTRLKVAAALTALGSRCVIDDDDWTLSGVVMRESDRTRAGVERALTDRARAVRRATAEAKADEAAIIDDRAADRLLVRAREGVVRYLSARGRVSARELSKSLRSDARQYIEPAIAGLLESGAVREFSANGRRLFEYVHAD